MLRRSTWAAVALGCLFTASTTLANDAAEGEGIYLMGSGMPSVFTFDRNSMSCSVSWGTMGAPGPGPFTEPSMSLDQVNFGMVVFSVSVDRFDAADGRIEMTGTARSITTVNDGWPRMLCISSRSRLWTEEGRRRTVSAGHFTAPTSCSMATPSHLAQVAASNPGTSSLNPEAPSGACRRPETDVRITRPA